jgi:hypothetical protein
MKEASAMVGLSPTTFWSLAQPQQWPTMYFAERDPHKPRHDFVDRNRSRSRVPVNSMVYRLMELNIWPF